MTAGAIECTGIVAQWCPIHGACSCDREKDHRHGGGFEEDPACPLHGPFSRHPVDGPFFEAAALELAYMGRWPAAGL